MGPDFIAYIFAIFRHWGPLATGVGALAVTALVEQSWPDHAPWWVWVAIVLSSILIASFLAWRELYSSLHGAEKTVLELREEVHQEKNRKLPLLEGRIDSILGGFIQEKKALGIYLLISVKNIGDAPSMAEGWWLDVQYEGAIVTERPIYIGEGFILRGDGGAIIKEFRRATAIEEVTSMPIAPGAMVRGWAQYVLTGLPSVVAFKAGIRLTVHFVDVRNREYIASHTCSGKQTPPDYLPGSGEPITLLRKRCNE